MLAIALSVVGLRTAVSTISVSSTHLLIRCGCSNTLHSRNTLNEKEQMPKRNSRL